jgi:hypothetical protein
MSIYPGLQFGAGYLLAAPLTTSGNPAPNPTPLSVGAIQNVKCSFNAEIKELYSQTQWALDSAVGKRSIKGSFEFAQMSNILLSQLFFGDSVAAGVVEAALNEPQTAVSSSFTVTHSTTFVGDGGVSYALTGVPLIAIPSGTPAAGQYKETAGVYTLSTADATASVVVNYTYSNTTLGTTLTAANHAMGYGPILALNVVFPYEGGGIGFYFPNVRLGKIDLTTKLDDYTMLTTDFQAFAGAGGVPFSSYQAF